MHFDNPMPWGKEWWETEIFHVSTINKKKNEQAYKIKTFRKNVSITEPGYCNTAVFSTNKLYHYVRKFYSDSRAQLQTTVSTCNHCWNFNILVLTIRYPSFFWLLCVLILTTMPINFPWCDTGTQDGEGFIYSSNSYGWRTNLCFRKTDAYHTYHTV